MYGEPIGEMAFDFHELERSLSRSVSLEDISSKGAELDHVFLLDTNRK